MTFSLIHPSIRPDKWREIYDAWLKAAVHPENVEYVLVVDAKWNFDGSLLAHWEAERGDLMSDPNIVIWDSDGYVASVNEAARAATGDVLIVIADDIWPAERWDEVLQKAVDDSQPHEFAIWVNNGGSVDRRAAVRDTIAEMPVVSRFRVERLGYLYYPGYLSMYSDNDFVEHCQLDAKEGRCTLIWLDEPVFPHLHPVSDPSIPVDAAYQWQNRPAAYALGRKLLEARRAANFTDVETPALPSSKRKSIHVCVAGGNMFSLPWVIRWTNLCQLGITHFDMILHFAYGVTNCYHARIGLATEVLKDQPSDFVLWLDHDQLVEPEHVLQLVADLEERPDIDMVAGWTVTGVDSYGTAPQLSFGFSMDRLVLPAQLTGYPEDLIPVLFSGFPLALMRYQLLAELGSESFWPYNMPSESALKIDDKIFHEGQLWLQTTAEVPPGGGIRPDYPALPSGEDVSFCLQSRDCGKKIFVDRRVGPLPHLKLRDIAAGVLG